MVSDQSADTPPALQTFLWLTGLLEMMELYCNRSLYGDSGSYKGNEDDPGLH